MCALPSSAMLLLRGARLRAVSTRLSSTTAALPETYVEGFHNKEAVAKLTYKPLGKTGMNFAPLAIGGSSVGTTFYGNMEDKESPKVVDYLLRQGLNYIDTAPWYGFTKSEATLGSTILPNIPRKAYYISTKVGRYKPEPLEMFDFSYKRTLLSVDESLSRLGLDYVDICQVHDVEFAPDPMVVVEETLPALEEARKQGKIKYIGVTGYSLSTLQHVIEKYPLPLDTVLPYARLGINNTTLVPYLPFFKSRGLGIINASPLGMGLLTPMGPPVWHPATPEIKAACAAAVKYCQEKGVDITRIGMYYGTRNPDVVTTLVSTNMLAQAQSNIAFLHTPLTAKEHEAGEEVIERFFKPLSGRESWEGVETAKYWTKVGKKLILSHVYGKGKI